MKRACSFAVLLFTFCCCTAQPAPPDSLKRAVAEANEDLKKVNLLLQLSKAYMGAAPSLAISYSTMARNLAEQLKYAPGKANALKNIGMAYYNQARYVETIDCRSRSYRSFDSIGDDAKATAYFLQSLQIAERMHNTEQIAYAKANIGTLYSNNQYTYDNAPAYYKNALALSEQLQDKNIVGGVLVNMGEIYMKQDKDDSALYYFKRSLAAYANTENIPYSLNDIGKIYTKEGNYKLAKEYHEKALTFANRLNLQLDAVQSQLGLGSMYYRQGLLQNALTAYGMARAIAESNSLKKELREAYKGLANSYAAQDDYVNAFNYQTLFTNLNDKFVNLDVAQKVNNLQTNFEIQKKQAQIDNLTLDQARQEADLKPQKFARNSLAVGLVLVFAITYTLFKLYYKVQRSREQLRKSLDELSAAQARLIQSEKLASLGSLTAGVAHEIQNPLNFINNFAEFNIELLNDGELELKENDAEGIVALVADLRDNQKKVMHHGQRADGIVKGMLQHARKDTGHKETTNINALADEYLRLSYHGLRAKDKDFNATLETHFDDAVGTVNVVPQDIGRVLLNLFNNAFYSVDEKKNQQGNSYAPTVFLSTKRVKDKIVIRVADNGMGISKGLVDKVFQPFFTTKPAGQGTGLGLSLSYDIIKAHGGEIKVETEEGAFTKFSIELPLNSAEQT